MFFASDFVKDGAHLSTGLVPLAFLAKFGEPALWISVLNIIILAAFRIYEARLRKQERLEEARIRSNERLELARLKLEVESRK